MIVDDLRHGLARQLRHVLAEIDGEVGLAVGLVGGDGAARDFGEDLPADLRGAARAPAALHVGDDVALHELARLASCRNQKAPFSPTTASTGHMRAMWSHQPAGRPVTGITSNPASLQALQRRVRRGEEPAMAW